MGILPRPLAGRAALSALSQAEGSPFGRIHPHLLFFSRTREKGDLLDDVPARHWYEKKLRSGFIDQE